MSQSPRVDDDKDGESKITNLDDDYYFDDRMNRTFVISDLVDDIKDTNDIIEWGKRYDAWELRVNRVVQKIISLADFVVASCIFDSFSETKLVQATVALIKKQNWILYNPAFEQWSLSANRNNTSDFDEFGWTDTLGSVIFKNPISIESINKIASTADASCYISKIHIYKNDRGFTVCKVEYDS